jgi:ribosome-associated translation inhibitor RaiA
MARHEAVRIEDVETVTRGDIPPDLADYAAEKVRALARYCPEPVLHARATLTGHRDPAMPRPFTAQLNLDLNGRPVRAQAAASTAREAIDVAQARLRRRLPELARHWEAVRGGVPSPAPHEWRHASEPAHRPPHFPRPPAEREVVRHKSFTLARESVDDAVVEMHQLDYDFHLFTEAGSDEDSVVYRAGPTGYRVAQVHPRPDRVPPSAVPLTVSQHPAPRLTVPDAAERLELTGLPFLFFAAADTGRGCVLYHRYDGHYGLITPAT